MNRRTDSSDLENLQTICSDAVGQIQSLSHAADGGDQDKYFGALDENQLILFEMEI